MDATGALQALPDSQVASLCLATPTQEELEAVCKLSYVEWGDSLTLPQFLEESDFLTKVPLAKNNGMLSWILTNGDQIPNQRPILASCETFCKRAFVTSWEGRLSEDIVYGVVSVFVNPIYRGCGYAGRLMQELAEILPQKDVGSSRCTVSILYSDIGKDFYSKHGWPAFPVNNHIELDPMPGAMPAHASRIEVEDLPRLCQEDEDMSRKSMASLPPGKTRIMIVPDVDHMLWHISKENFACQKIFGKVPQAKGAIAGEHGCRIWTLWAHRYYGLPDSSAEGNTLYILRFVIDNQEPTPEQLESQTRSAKAVLQAAQAEAAEWNLQCVKLWHPMPLVQKLIDLSGLEHRWVEREEDSIASLRWFGDSDSKQDSLEWVASEKYAWV